MQQSGGILEIARGTPRGVPVATVSLARAGLKKVKEDLKNPLDGFYYRGGITTVIRAFDEQITKGDSMRVIKLNWRRSLATLALLAAFNRREAPCRGGPARKTRCSIGSPARSSACSPGGSCGRRQRSRGRRSSPAPNRPRHRRLTGISSPGATGWKGRGPGKRQSDRPAKPRSRRAEVRLRPS